MASRPTSLISALATVLLAAGGCGPETPDFTAVRRPLGAEPLPNWATPAERELQRRAGPPPVFRDRFPPPSGYRVPAEYEPTAAVVMTWAGYTSMLGDIAAEAADAGAQVWVVGGPASLPGVPAAQYRDLNLAYDSVWSRDYGPVGIHEQTGMLGVIDTTYRHWAYRQDDDALPCKIAQETQAACYQTELILDGGNYMTDGRGTVFVTDRLYEWNDNLTEAQVNGLLADYLGASTIHVLAYARDNWGDPADGTGHIDMFAKLLDDCNVLVAETDEDPFRLPLEQAAAFFAGLECAPGQNYSVHRVPGWTQWGTWYTYTNALIVNQTVILPGYSGGQDALARQVVQAALPGFTVVTVNSDASITAGGSIHCVTRELPAAAQSGCASAADCDLAHVDQAACTDGQCSIVTCQAGWADCDGAPADGCETPLGTIDDCAACSNACAFTHAQAACQAGACAIAACDPTWDDCDAYEANGCETRIGTDANCAACGDVCARDHAQTDCQQGDCVLVACNPDWADCDGDDGTGCETPLGTDTDCAGCGDDCRSDQSVCEAGACVPSGCEPGWADCDGLDANGCETPLGTDTDCAGCADACTFERAQAACVAGGCSRGACDAGWADCDGDDATGCETALDTDAHCGACDAQCQAPAACQPVGAGHACVCPDADGDGAFDAACGGIDCDDQDPAVHPGADEACNQIDDDCDGRTDEDPACQEPDAPKSKKGCGCSHSRPAGAPLTGLLLLGLLALRRRRP